MDRTAYNKLVQLGKEHPELRPHIRPILAAAKQSSRKMEIAVNTALDEVTEAVDESVAVMDRWMDIAPRGSFRANRELNSKLREAESLLRDARKLMKDAGKEISSLEGAARRSL